RLASSVEAEEVLSRPRFHLDLWLCFTAQSWILDVGRPVVMLVLPADWFPLNRPGAAEYLHMLHVISTPLLLLKMLERSPRTLPRLAIHLGIIAVVMGTSLHLIADAITQRLLLIGYQLHLSIRENPVMTNLKPSSLIDAFELLFYYDDTLAHLMWYVPLFLVLFLFFSGCFGHRRQMEKMPPAAWMLLPLNAAYCWSDCFTIDRSHREGSSSRVLIFVLLPAVSWYLITEGQTFILFIFTFFAMTATVMHQRRRDMVPDGNGLLMLYSFSAALFLVAVWVACLWSDGILRKKHPGLIYVPQPRVVYTLHLHQTT
ncbi:hypothetical protein L3Q82_023531, partial [Scortum barcoo]